MKLSRSQIVSQLEAKGLVFTEFSLASEGDYAPEDAVWNYLDILHLHHVHGAIWDTGTYINDDAHIYVNLFQFPGGFRVPLVFVNYLSGPRRHTHYTTFLMFVIAVESVCEPAAAGRTRVVTTYNIGSYKLFKWLHPFLRLALTRNFSFLMKSDVGIRERRGQLRRWGYQFNPDSYTKYVETLDVNKPNVSAPSGLPPLPAQSFTLTEALGQDGEIFIGRDDHLGLRAVRRGNRLFFYPRLCPHEGASLDKQSCGNGSLRCLWHGKAFSPLAEFDLTRSGAQQIKTDHHEITLESGAFSIRPRG